MVEAFAGKEYHIGMSIILSVVILILAIAVIVLVVLLRRARVAALSSPNAAEIEAKQEHLDRALAYIREQGEVANDDIERLLGVSDATASRYLSQLKSQGRLIQIGTTGKSVRYRAK